MHGQPALYCLALLGKFPAQLATAVRAEIVDRLQDLGL
jgi:hypothetical protein